MVLWRAGLILLCAAAAVLTAPGSAVALKAPPGNSEVDQYAETLPGPGGNQTINPSGGGGGGSTLPPATERQLDRLGPDGRAAAQLARSTAPDRGRIASHGSSDPGGTHSSSAFGAVSDAISGSDGGGLGVLLPLILVGVGATGIGYALARHRARQAG
jgi:hypothetical protein